MFGASLKIFSARLHVGLRQGSVVVHIATGLFCSFTLMAAWVHSQINVSSKERGGGGLHQAGGGEDGESKWFGALF